MGGESIGTGKDGEPELELGMCRGSVKVADRNISTVKEKAETLLDGDTPDVLDDTIDSSSVNINTTWD